MMRLLSALGVLAALVFVVASAAMNWTFMKGQGATVEEGHILGAVSVAVSILNALLPLFMAHAWVNGRRAFVAFAAPVFVVFLCFSLLAALGFAAANRGLVTGGRETITVRHSAAVGEAGEVEARLKAVPLHRPAAVVEEALRGVRQDKRWQSSKECEDATAQTSREFCKTFFDLRAELAAAVEASRLQVRLETLRGEVRRLLDAGAGREKDPQAAMLAVLSFGRLDVSGAQMALIVFVAVLVELGAAFGLYLATGFLRRSPKPVTVEAHVVEEPRRSRPLKEKPVERLQLTQDGSWRVA